MPGSISYHKRSVGGIIQSAIEAENSSHEIYLQLSKMFTHVPDVSKFWQNLVYNETKHAYTLLKVQTSLSDEQLATAADQQLMDSVTSVTSLLNKVSLGTVETLDDAYEIAHEIEYSEVNHIFKCLAGNFITREDEKRIVLNEIHEHQQKLTYFTENFDDRTWRRQVLTRSTTPLSSN